MKKSLFLFLPALIAILFNSCEKPWQPLFNGENLDGWQTYVGPTEEGADPIGLNKDPLNLFSVVDLDEEKAIRISGEINASLATLDEFENYHLMVEFKWGDEVFATRNSGLLYHSYGDFGAGLGVWMSSHELQLWTGNIGDSYRMGKSYCEIPMKKNSEGKYNYVKGAEKTASIPDTETRIVAKDGDYENPVGEWNTIELYCVGTTSVHVVNGNVNMINYNSGKYLGEGKTEPLSKGKIQFQSEGGELFIRTIKIKPIKEIPENIL
uniref:3-keto-disaccharide hydrolase n=1 Tax=uncultured Draconibacterium sp. TaxID=1573823 RepID=UPI0032178806